MTNWKSRIIGSGTEDPTQLVANPKNWRIHPKAQQDALADVLERVGWVQQVLVNKVTGNVVDGHLRVELALSRGEPSVPVLYVELDPSEEALILASLDPLASMAATDAEKLRELMDEVSVNADLEKLLAEMAGPLPPAGHTDADDAPQAPDDADVYVRPGDLYLLGTHRLLCGDATNAEDVARLMDGAVADMMFTDPPYGVGYQTPEKMLVGDKYASHRRQDGATVTNDDLAPEATRDLVASALRAAPLRKGGVFYVCSPSGDLELQFRLALVDADLPLRQQVVWAKDRFVFGRQDYQWRHETLLYGWRDGAAHHWCGDRTQDTVWEVKRPSRSDEHPTMKPAELVERAIANSTKPADAVYDPFVGSGTTIIAAEQLGRRCYAMELEPKYVQVAKERWEAFTGKEAVRVEADA